MKMSLIKHNGKGILLVCYAHANILKALDMAFNDASVHVPTSLSSIACVRCAIGLSSC